MKVCTKCNKSYLDDAKFCEVCGTSLDLVQAESEAKPKPKKIKPKRLGPKIGTVKKSDAPSKLMAKPLKRAEPFVSSTTVFQSDNDTELGGTLLVEEPKTAEPEPVVEPEVAVEEPKTAAPEPVVEPEVAVEEPKTAEPDPVVEPEVAVAEPKTAEPEPVVEPEVAVTEPKTAAPDPVVEPEVAVAEPKTAEPEPNRRQNKKKGISLPLIIAVVGLLALIGVGAFFLFGEKTATFIKCQEHVSFVKEGGLYNLKVETDGDFEVAEDIEWISASVADGRVSIKCDPNDNGVYRSVILHLVSGELSESVEICQKGSATYINLSPEKLEFPSKGGEVTVEIDSDGSGFSIVGQECEITNKSERGFTVSVSSHSGAPREGKITVTSGNVSKELLFYQKGVCSRCGGTGKVVCSACGGTGKNQSWFSYGDPCSACGRSGKVACMACGGTGEK